MVFLVHTLLWHFYIYIETRINLSPEYYLYSLSINI